MKPPLLFVAVFLLLGSVTFVGAQSPLQLNNSAVELLEEGRYLEGIELLKKATSTAPHVESLRQNLVNAYLATAGFFLQRHEYDELTDLMYEAERFADRRECWVLRGVGFYRQKLYDEAEIELQEARAMGEPDAQILRYLGEIFYFTDRLYEATDVLEAASELAPDDSVLQDMLAKVRRELSVEQDMDKTYGGHFVITFDGEKNDDLGDAVLDVLEEAYNELGSWLAHYPEQRVAVLLYSRQQFSDLTGSPDWAGGLYDGKVRLPVGGVQQVGDSVRMLLYHEYMHVLLRDIVGANLPGWLNEGLATYAGDEYLPLQTDLLERARAEGGLFSLQQLEGTFSRFNGDDVKLAYQQSQAMVSYLLNEYGWYRLRDYLDALAAGNSFADAFVSAYGIYGLTYSKFEADWREKG
ncbi:Peptidase MA superfamily protein [Malonomonas rubra DSM 5091]|uniref:Peptidase MA superfamily protein n=1 Tax=Malonomonas rubra DSM 5091 TaxID=1122189 RepID=A0A1M6BNV2_MALRU|nr:peptidase MA family metallohydrolase [Malonomonas rubra]SHI50431.1 Peptidase MA superfamily protein [Malonomonas rubra DSM 5091]